MRFFAILFILVLATVLHNRVSNYHYHRCPNGHLFAHSHPYDKEAESDPLKKHNHGNTDLIYPVGSIEMSDPVSGLPDLVYTLVNDSTIALSDALPMFMLPGGFRGRAPPVLVV